MNSCVILLLETNEIRAGCSRWGKRCRSRYLKFYCYEALISKNIVNYKAHEEILKRYIPSNLPPYILSPPVPATGAY